LLEISSHPHSINNSSVSSISTFYYVDHLIAVVMTDKLPPNLLVLFAPRPALRWVPPSDHAPEERKTATISGLADFLPQLEEYKKTDQYVATESWLQRKDRVKLEKKQAQEKLLKDGPVSCKGDPLCFDHPLIFSPTSGQFMS